MSRITTQDDLVLAIIDRIKKEFNTRTRYHSCEADSGEFLYSEIVIEECLGLSFFRETWELNDMYFQEVVGQELRYCCNTAERIIDMVKLLTIILISGAIHTKNECLLKTCLRRV